MLPVVELNPVSGDMKQKRERSATLSFLATLTLILPVAAQATNRAYWNLWTLEVGMVCFVQSPEYRNSPLGSALSKGSELPGWERLDQSPSSKCLRGTQWVSPELCTDVTNLDEKALSGNLDPLIRKHAIELDGLQDVFSYLEKSRRSNSDAVPCPDTDRARVNADRSGPDKDEAKAAEYTFCIGVSNVMADAAALREIKARTKNTSEDDLTLKEVQRMRTDFGNAARLRSSRGFVVREMYNVTDKLNELRRKEVNLNDAPLKKESDKCRGIWINEVRPFLDSKSP